MSSYHGWTHRPKAQGGTDPIPASGAELTAAFWLIIPGQSTIPQQTFELLNTWEEVVLDASFGINWDQVTQTDAVSLIDGDVRVRVDSHTVGSSEQVWFCGFLMRVGSYYDEGAVNLTEWYDADATVKMHSFDVSFTAGMAVSCPLVPADDGNYHMLEQYETSFGVSATMPFESSSTEYDPIDAESAQAGIGIQVRHNVDWVDDIGNLKGPPASRGGYLYGFRYDRPLNV